MSEPASRISLLDTIGRTERPRRHGITIVLDTGFIGPSLITDLTFNAGSHWDFAKIAWGSSLITDNLAAKLELYRANGVVPMLGGTLFEYAYLRDKIPLLLDFVKDLRVHVEISDGVIAMERPEKLRWIETFAKHVDVFSEVGGKVAAQSLDWKRAIQEELAAGAQKVVIEGREIGPVGKELRTDIVDAVVEAAPLESLIFEALERKQQVWLIKRFGPNVNLGNIPPLDLLTLESFRRGLKEHTLLSTFESLRSS